jgi:hypothetical protein
MINGLLCIMNKWQDSMDHELLGFDYNVTHIEYPFTVLYVRIGQDKMLIMWTSLL